MEVIDLPGYTEDEKFEIARRYLVARQIAANGLTAEQAEIADDAIHSIIRDYTREAGVRKLEREIGTALRSVAMKIAEGSATRIRIAADDLHEILGARKFESEVAMRTSIPGVATGLAWTPVGGDILFIEATRIPGKGGLILTGQLGEVMRESAQAALSLVKGKAASLGIDTKLFENSDIHVHVPAGAIPKDGPSRRRGDVHGARLVADRPHGQERHRDDRRDQPAGARAAGRRHQGEDHRRGARRARDGHPAGAQPQGLRGHPRSGPQCAALHLGGTRGAGHRGRARTGPPRRRRSTAAE